MKISKVFLYDEPSVPEIKINELGKFIKEKFCVEVEIREPFFSFFKDSTNKIAYELATSKIFNPLTPFEKHTPTSEEIMLEENSITNFMDTNNIVMYDGFEFRQLVANTIPEDYRYHGRAVICSNPAIISTTGIIEAPAKPREYYLGMFENMVQGLNLDMMKNQFKGKYLEYHDVKLSEIVKGYTMQVLFYYLTGQSFCESKNCRLYNAHWQEDLLHSQITVGKLCNDHQKILNEITKKL
ncbi:MAG: hypothetical protein E6L05_05685 [Thaumarchaeota archaeon]|nr:MAG: hypothetical protein E6L05_05685 [Nitrososphaerota archaeon]